MRLLGIRPSTHPPSPFLWSCEMKMSRRSSGYAATQLSWHRLKLASWREFATLSLPNRTFSPLFLFFFFDKGAASRESCFFFFLTYFFRHQRSLPPRAGGTYSQWPASVGRCGSILGDSKLLDHIKELSLNLCHRASIRGEHGKIGPRRQPPFLSPPLGRTSPIPEVS